MKVKVERAGVVLAVLVALDALTTYALAHRYPVEQEFNPILKCLLAVDKRLVFAYAPVEYLVLLCLYHLNKRARERLGVKKRLEYSVIGLVAVVVSLNVVGLLVSR